MARPLGKALLTGAACVHFRNHLNNVKAGTPGPSSWLTVEDDFLAAMELFDNEVIAGRATEGERQNGKGDYFNDLLAVVLENASGADLSRRSGVSGLIFPNHNLDVTYPPTGNIIDVLIEAKMLGTPQHPGNASTEKPEGRNGSADLLKRCKEAGFKTIDLKAAYGMLQSAVGAPQQQILSGDLTSWLRTVSPKSYLVAAVRVTGPSDARAVIEMADNMTRVMDGVGLFLYRPKGHRKTSLSPASYERVAVPPSLDMTRVLQRVTSDLRSAASAPRMVAPAPPAASVQDALEDAGVSTKDTGDA